MTSFLTEVLVTAGKVEKEDLNGKLSEIQKEIIRLKDDVRNFMEDNYIELTSKLTADQNLVLEAEKLVEKMRVLQERINQQIKIELSGSTKELKNLSHALKESSINLQLSNKLLTLHQCMKSMEEFQEEKRYIDCANTLKRMQILLNDQQEEHSQLNIYEAIKEKYTDLYSSFVTESSELLQKLVYWTGIDPDKDTRKVTLTVTAEFENIRNLISALYYIDNLPKYLQRFSAILLKYIIDPIINEDCSVYVVKHVFTIELLQKKRTQSYKSVLHNLQLLFKFLHEHLNVSIDNDMTFLKTLQPYLLNPLSENLTKNCIAHTIPSSSTELKNFTEVMETIREFQDYLVEIGFISTDQLFLSNYANNIDKLFIDRVCQDFMIKARSIMKKDLHDSIRYEPQEPLRFAEVEFDDSEFKIDRKLSEATFHLPSCQISKSAKETLELARNVLDEACRSPEICAVRLFRTCRNIFEMYAGLVVEHHRKLLETIPQQVALFHNNCMYLAHHLLTLAHEYRSNFPSSLQKLNLTFADQTLVLRDVGSECFLEHMRYQRNIITDILKESGLSALGQTAQLHPSTERALRQCIRQLELLKTVWSDVLPKNIYCRALGCITNSMIDDLIMRVISVEDIPADVATDLVTLFSVITNRVPSIFPDPNEINQHVRKWTKFLYLIKVLGASLKEIEIMWANGKGSLAQEFMASQVKQLIRALFQNTERRAILLASIK